MRSLVLINIAILLVMFSACNKPALNDEQIVACKDALKSLRKVQAATQVGVNTQQYPQLLVDAKANVNAASALLPDGDLRNQLQKTMDAYVDVAGLWRHKIESPSYLSDTISASEEPWKTMIMKYSLQTEPNLIYGGAGQPPIPGIHIDKCIPVIWARADSYLDESEKAFRKLVH